MSVSIGPKKLGGAAGPGDGVGPRRSARRAKASIGGNATPSIFDLASAGDGCSRVGHLNKGGSNTLATNRGDDLCRLRVFRCPVASLRSDNGKIVLIAQGLPHASSQQNAPSIWHPCNRRKCWAGLSFAAARMRPANMLGSPLVLGGRPPACPASSFARRWSWLFSQFPGRIRRDIAR